VYGLLFGQEGRYTRAQGVDHGTGLVRQETDGLVALDLVVDARRLRDNVYYVN
jgi:hypothetical protein